MVAFAAICAGLNWIRLWFGRGKGKNLVGIYHCPFENGFCGYELLSNVFILKTDVKMYAQRG